MYELAARSMRLVPGIKVGPDTLPGALGTVVSYLPSAALADGLHNALAHGALTWTPVAVLVAWAAAATVLATRTTKLT